jgi:hypothetical protein
MDNELVPERIELYSEEWDAHYYADTGEWANADVNLAQVKAGEDINKNPKPFSPNDPTGLGTVKDLARLIIKGGDPYWIEMAFILDGNKVNIALLP